MSEPETTLLMDVIRVTSLSTTQSHLLLKHVLPAPFSCPGSCSEQYVIATSLPVELEIQMGQLGQKHLTRLREELQRRCTSECGVPHLRTDGETVWIPS